MLFILRLRSAIFVVVTSAEIIPSRQRGQFASSYIRIGEFVPELPRNPNLCGTPDRETDGRQCMAELWGPIVIRYSTIIPRSSWYRVQANSPMFYLGAREGTNNTGELVGIAQALLWVRNDGGDEPAAILYD